MADITVEGITNTGGTGVFDKLMESINGQIETQYLNNRITGADYATVYLGSLQTALAQSIQFAMQEVLTESQIDSIIADTDLKAKQLEIAGIEKLAKQFELDNLLPVQLEKATEEVESANKQQLLADAQLKTAYADRVLKDKQAAKLGLDNVMKTTELAKQSNPSFVYTPNYEE